MGQRSTCTKLAHRAVLFALIFAVTSASTGTVLASDACKVSLVQTFTAAARSVQRHTHTKTTLAAWEAWGNAYIAKHGHPYVARKHPHPATLKERDVLLEFACEPLPVPTEYSPVTMLLEPEIPPILENFPVFIAENTPPPDTPGSPPNDTTQPTPPIFFPPIFIPPFNPIPQNPGPPVIPPIVPPVIPPVVPPVIPPVVPPVVPPVIPPVVPPVILPVVPPVVPIPEPGTFVLLTTGLAALAALRVRRNRGRKLS